MQISSTSSALPLSTQVIKKAGDAAQDPASPVTPEQVNTAVDRGADRVTLSQQSADASQANRREAASEVYSNSSQQKQLDIYLAVATESDVDDQPTPLEVAREVSQQQPRPPLNPAGDYSDNSGLASPGQLPASSEPTISVRA
ncbi:hypothetical protein [Pseudomonas turukhanskensis]|uniref:Uncharacterized protein n=1 Tax=Pseudomonas turukhanskensis TaxID=1806536 RepID=A0A9W6K413_9PSED|nr:hypothetical protein [Pseudomonas turukhanskensis]GLK88447.1 hypothetical protein GCM10017655_15090 [Pseudomonas turukhanskensis]